METAVEDPASLTFLKDLVADETTPSEEFAEDVDYDGLSLETSDILAQADELLSHETPVGVVAPDPIFVPMPEPIELEKAEEPVEVEDTEETAPEGPALPTVPAEPEESNDYEEDYYDEEPEGHFPVKKFIITALILLLLSGAAFGGYYYYENYYLQTISAMELTGHENALTVSITTDIDESLLTIVCTDNFGGRLEKPVSGGKANFTDLSADTLYKISMEIDGFHKLTGDISDTYTTPKQTEILDFTAITDTQDGSAALRFTVNGQDAETWRVVYTAEGEEEKSMDFTGHMVTINGLTVGKTYSFRLESDANLYITGIKTVDFTAAAIVTASDLEITGCSGGTLTAQWAVPEGQTVESWTVTCYNDSGYKESITTTETNAQFTGLDSTLGYTVEVKAAGMNAVSRAYVSAGSVTVTDTKVEVKSPTELLVRWEFDGPKPEGNWILLYSVENNPVQEVVRSESNWAVIPNMIPGAAYNFTLEIEGGTKVFHESFNFSVPEAEEFMLSFGGRMPTAKASNMQFKMCQTPGKENWNRKDIKNYTDTFKAGQKASFLVRLLTEYDTSSTKIATMYVIRDAQGNFLSSNVVTQTWTSMWLGGYCELDVPKIPDAPGSYTIEIYFAGGFAHSQPFTVTE